MNWASSSRSAIPDAKSRVLLYLKHKSLFSFYFKSNEARDTSSAGESVWTLNIGRIPTTALTNRSKDCEEWRFQTFNNRI